MIFGSASIKMKSYCCKQNLEVDSRCQLLLYKMKFQYLLEIIFIRLTLKTATSQNLKISLVASRTDNTSIFCQGCSHQLRFRRLQRKLDLSDLEAFKSTFQSEEIHNHTIEIVDQGVSSTTLEVIHLSTAELIKIAIEKGNIASEEKYEGKHLNLQFKINLSKKEAQKIQFNIINPDGEKEIRQSSRARRPPELNIKTKSILRASSKSIQDKEQPKQDLFKGLDKTPDKKLVKTQKTKEKQNQNWQIMSAFPQAISAWLKKKSHKPQEQTEFQQVKELLESHHPTVSTHEITSKLSLKLKIVILLLLFGVFVLIVDMFTDKTGRKKNQKAMKKGKKDTDHSIEQSIQGQVISKKKKRKVRNKKHGSQV